MSSVGRVKAIELLAPARTAEIGIEAILHGADAVYIGGPSFGARHAACNSVEDIARLCEFGAPYGVPVYVTLNTLLKDDELIKAQQLAWQLYDAGVSALIIQDANLLALALPPIALHASTQMDNRTAAKILALEKAGFSQAVLARELDIEQIKAIHQAVPDITLEAFVHGALCVGISGLCHASERLFGRSADRGECAQFCRLKFDLIDSKGHTIVHDRHLLSLRDMNRSADIEQMMDAGVRSFKIEGRLKDAAYVKNITAHYRKLIDNIIARRPEDFCRSSLGRENIAFTPDPARSFNRGFTVYLSDNSDISSPFTSKSTGQHIGQVRHVRRKHITLSANTAAQVVPVAAGDGLCFYDSNHTLQGFRVNSIDGDKITPRPMPNGIEPGMDIYRNFDHAFNRQLEKSTATRSIGIDMAIKDISNGFTLSAQIAAGSQMANARHLPAVCIDFEYKHEVSLKPQADNIRTQLARLGNTAYMAKSIEIEFADDWFIPSSVLADMRRRLVDALDCQARIMLRERHQPKQTCIDGLQDVKPQKDYSKLMICRLCLKREIGLCPSHKSGTRALLPFVEAEPQGALYLRMEDGRQLPLSFDCQQCRMELGSPSPTLPREGRLTMGVGD